MRAERKRHPHWGPRKLLHHLSEHPPRELREILLGGGRLPAASTAGDILKRAGLVEPRRRRSHPPHPGSAALGDVAPNDVWSADFKGEFRTQDRKWCYPLTISDAASRYLLACEGLTSVEHNGAREVFKQLFRQSGLPVAIRSDNGCPFCSNGIGGLSGLSVWWMKLGIVHQRITPENLSRMAGMRGCIERSNPRLLGLLLQISGANKSALWHFDRNTTSCDLMRRSPCRRPLRSGRLLLGRCRTARPEYPGHMEVRTVRQSGEIKFLGHTLFVSMVLTHERNRPGRG